jgi:predicted dehydrogenase
LVPIKQITAVIIGAGNRGKDVYGQFILKNPDQIKVVAVAEPSPIRRNDFTLLHQLSPQQCYESWETLLQKPKLADVAIITTQDQFHTQPALKAMEKGYQVLLEKPMATTLSECVLLVETATKTGCELRIAHVLRYTHFFQTIYNLIKNGEIGEIMTIDLRENVSFYHYAHSFVRGNWSKQEKSSPMILAKSCHDLDILYWLVGKPASSISSFGSLSHFRSENAPAGATQRCLDNCPAADECKYFAPHLYIDIIPLLRIAQKSTSQKTRFIANLALNHPHLFSKLKDFIPPFKQVEEYKGWPVSTITDDLTLTGKWDALKTSDYGRCVYYSDNDVVDHQVVILEFKNKITATFTMHGFSHEEGRTIRIDGTKGTIIGEFLASGNRLRVHDHLTGNEKVISDTMADIDTSSGHGGGDFGLMNSFVRSIQNKDPNDTLTSAEASLESHIMAFAAEESRLNKETINLDKFRKRAFNKFRSN